MSKKLQKNEILIMKIVSSAQQQMALKFLRGKKKSIIIKKKKEIKNKIKALTMKIKLMMRHQKRKTKERKK